SAARCANAAPVESGARHPSCATAPAAHDPVRGQRNVIASDSGRHGGRLRAGADTRATCGGERRCPRRRSVVCAMPRPLVSVIVPNYNYARFLGAAIESALAQTYEPIEVIVVDDGSTDDSRHVIAGFGNRVRALFQENRGQAGANLAG